MKIEITLLPESQLAEYASVPIRFSVTQRITLGGSTELATGDLRVSPVAVPFEKDFDALPGMSPLEWPSRHRLRDWRILVARRHGVVVGGAALAPAADVGMNLDELGESAVLWDLRVAPRLRGAQIGTALFRAGEQWATHSAYASLLAEAQDINVVACRFYQAMGCRLMEFEPGAYPDFPDEARLLWRRDLPVDRASG